MTQLVVEGELLAKLQSLKERVELLDSEGRLVGVFDPTENATKFWVRSPISDEELQRRRQNPETRSLSEILARLDEL